MGRAPGQLSRRSAFDPTPNRLARARAEQNAAGRAIIDLTVSNPTRAGLPYAAEQICAALADSAALRYAPAPFGLPRARAAVAEVLGIEPRRVVLTASTSEAYGWLFKLLADPGEAILAPQPSYPLFEQLAALEGVELIPYPLAYDGAWHVDLPRLRAAVTPRARAILAVSPNNPTGQRLTRTERAAMAATGLPLIVDEVFAEYPLGPAPDAVRALDDPPGLTFALGGLSKRCGLPQMKAGWIGLGGPAAGVDAALSRLELIADTWLSIGAPVQHALPDLLAAGALTRAAINSRLRRNLARLKVGAAGTAVSVLPADGGWYAVLTVPRVMSDEDWALTLLRADGVWVQPGFFYDFATEGHLVMSLLTPPGDFDEGIDRLFARVRAEAG